MLHRRSQVNDNMMHHYDIKFTVVLHKNALKSEKCYSHFLIADEQSEHMTFGQTGSVSAFYTIIIIIFFFSF